MKHWKTTLGGFGGGIAAIGLGIKLIASGDLVGGASSVVTGVGMAFAGWHATDK
jgi:hypothetical protein